ncbi:MAG TPA: zinc ABC transporter substrate-binding protein [Methanothermobacter sp.]|nr:periplasmic solute binding protein [Methanothermobacter sp. MT-2]HHW05054.1 zinc ABC transporter solute-binding protein [Methanothermobacter sp.]HOK72560.1 zinc ABC transporter substrate-binding protein [Methanothermobacter sp.]HOL69377.1 zinc ABC transporter substrate-binding protein [Methanothermobacter sp.]HPQ04047.1 zinc ABC transporter substrate-binding protein [Methanothermobacter sp.]
MKKTKIFILIATITILICAFYITSKGGETGPEEKIIVAASIMPQKEFIEAVGGDKVKVIVMVPPGADPHTYEPQPSQLRELSKAKIYFQVGSGIEFEKTWMEKLKELNPEMKIINCSEGIKLIKEDPHVWTSPQNAIIMVENIYKALIKEDPANREYYTKNKDQYISRLKELDKKFNQTLTEKQNKKILVYHPAWTYLFKDYKIEQITIEQEGKEPSPQKLAKIIQEAKKANIKIIIISPQSNKQSAQAIADEIGAKIVTIDPLAENYIKNMEKMLQTLKDI